MSRSLDVIFECGTEDDIVQVSEPSMCQYMMTFRTPLVCYDEVAEQLRSELQQQSLPQSEFLV